jgi:hypothetical protein
MSNVPNVPNELKITINTNIPGFQSIKYKPYMTLPDDKNDGSIQFNPLVKLNPSIIKSLPVDVQKKEFFNKGLFQSLINSHGLIREKSLVEATKNGYVDNNIKVTLDTLFPSNSIIYINKQPYAIADIQWRKGDWKIDKKIQQVPELESSRITDPYLYQSVVKDEIISGENELQQLPKEIIYGSNYTGPQNVASGVKNPENPEKLENQEKPNTYSPLSASQTIQQPSQPSQPSQPIQQNNKSIKPTPKYLPLPPAQPMQPVQPIQLIQPTEQNNNYIKPMKPTPKYLPLAPSESVQQNIKPAQPMQYPALPPSVPSEPTKPIEPPKSTDLLPPKKPAKILQIADSEYDDDKETDSTYEIKLNSSRKSTTSLRSYFKDKDYYFMLNTIFKNMNDNEKSVVDKIFKETSGVDVKPSNNLSVKAYNITTDNIRVNQNTGAGDCFFIAVADAINFYNSNVNSNADKIIYNNYGKGNMIYTQKILREVVSYYILHLNPINFNELNDALDYNVDSLNNRFAEQYDDYKKNILHNNTITPNVFFDIVNNIYHSDDNFLIMKPTKMTEETLRKPFRLVNKTEIKNYIESSDYWANTVAIDALCEILGLNIITIESIDDKLRIPYIYNNTKPWSKYMFLYHENNHYELISFDYIFKTFRREPSFSIKTHNVRKVIFDKIGNIFPPFNIIFLIFATNYINISESRDKKNFQLLTPIIQSIFNIFNEIVQNKKTDDNKKFLKLFYEYFTPSPTVFKPIEGGAPYQYRVPYVSSYTKNNNSLQSDPAKSNISYYITIDMDLQKGTTLSSKDLSNLKCRQRWNSVRKSYADLRGLNYIAMPDYSNLPSQNNKTKSQKGDLGLKSTRFNTNANANARTKTKTKKRLYLS